MWKNLYPHLNFVPEEFEGYVAQQNNFACNMGIFGGSDIYFLQKYSDKAFEFAEKNKNLPEKVSGSNFNIFFEQVLLHEIMLLEKKKSSYLIDEDLLIMLTKGMIILMKSLLKEHIFI